MGASVLIVDDHPGFRAQARRLLESDGLRVVGEAGDCASGLAAAREPEPHLALVDVCLPDGDGFELASRIAALADPPAVILISSRDRAELDALMAGSGALGFVPKSELTRDAIEELLGLGARDGS